MATGPYALYYDRHLIGVITNPDIYGSIDLICDSLSPHEGLACAVSINDDMHSINALFDTLRVDRVIADSDDDDVKLVANLQHSNQSSGTGPGPPDFLGVPGSPQAGEDAAPRRGRTPEERPGQKKRRP